MPHLICDGRSLECPPGATVLDTLTSHGVQVPSGCRNGVCQCCLVRAVSGTVPAAAQRGLSPELQESGHFLACSCRPTEDMEVAIPREPVRRLQARVIETQRLAADILSVRLQPRGKFAYSAGQFLRLYRDDASRCYSIASVPTLDEHIELHVQRVPQGAFSSWLHDAVQPGQSVRISEAMGQCRYIAGHEQQPMLLIGTGCGLAPLSGIARDALHRGHRGPIRLYHGSREAQNLYQGQALAELARQHPNFDYFPCVSGGSVPSWATPGRALERALADCPDLDGWRVFLCGNAAMVEAARKRAFLAGAALAAIHADPFLPN